MKKFTDEQIIKALECCIAQENFEEISCEICPYERVCDCKEIVLQNALDLINRQKAEIENLKQIIDEEDREILKLQKRIVFWREDLNYQPEKIKSEAIKEFAEKVKEEIRFDDCEYDCADCNYGCRKTMLAIDNLVKEMTEGKL